MNLRDSRERFQLSNRQLRRARRLYVALTWRTVRNGDDIFRLVQRMQNAGLYSQKTFIRDLEWSYMRYYWRLHWREFVRRHPSHSLTQRAVGFTSWCVMWGWRWDSSSKPHWFRYSPERSAVHGHTGSRV